MAIDNTHPYKGQPHLVSLMVDNTPEPRGKIFQINEKWIFLRNVKRHQIIRIYDGFSVDMALLRYFVGISLDEIHYALEDKLYITTPGVVQRRGYRWGRGSRWQYILPRRYWNQEDWHQEARPYEPPLIPDWTVQVIGPQLDERTGYGPGTEGGTIFRREV
jgi:hypothetical protein